MTTSNRSRSEATSARRPASLRHRSVRSIQPTAEALESRRLLTGYAPAAADFDGDGLADIAVLRYFTSGTQQVFGRTALMIQSSKTGGLTGYEMGVAGTDQPTPADFDGDGKADPAVYGFQNDLTYGNFYGTTTTPGVEQPFPNGSGRFAYIPSSGNYPDRPANAVNGTWDMPLIKAVIVNIGGPGDIPAVNDYDGDGKADFAVYQPSKAQFLYYASSTFNPSADPKVPGNAPVALPFGKVGAVPASAHYLGTGRAQFAVYDAASGTFFVRPDDGRTTITATLGGPGDIPVAADYEGVGRASFAVYDPNHGVFLIKPADGSAIRTVSIGFPGDVPVVGKFADGRANFATYTASTRQFQYIQFPGGVTTKALADPDAIPIKRTDDHATLLHAEYAARTVSTDVMFLGDSITYGWPSIGTASWEGRIKQFNVVDTGVSFDSTQNLLWRIVNGELKVRPKVVVLNIGTNDFAERTPAEVSHSIRVIIDQIHALSPGTSVLLMGVMPRGQDSASDPLNIRQYHAFIAAQVRDLNQHYIPNLARPFKARDTSRLPSGDYSIDLRSFSANSADLNNYFVNASLTRDLLHPNSTGYDLWAREIASPLRLMLHRPLAPGDYDGDGKTDIGVYGPNVRGFATQSSFNAAETFLPYGIAGAGQTLMAPGDYDGDGKADYAMYGPSFGGFAITVSSSDITVFIGYGLPGAGQSIPTPGDYDGDGKTDLAVYVPTFGAYGIQLSATNTGIFAPFGIPGAGQSIPAPGDYDGDGKTDLAIYLPTPGVFAYRPSGGGTDVLTQYGIGGNTQAIPVPGDYDGDGKSDIALYIPSVAAYLYRESGTGRDVAKYYGIVGIGQTIPAPGDYDGDGRTDLAVYGPSVRGFAYQRSGSGANVFVPYGIAGAGQSIPTTSSYDVTIGQALGQVRPAGSTRVAVVPIPAPADPTGSKTASRGEPGPAATTTPAKPAANPPTTTTGSGYQPTRIAQTTPVGPLDGWKSWTAGKAGSADGANPT